MSEIVCETCGERAEIFKRVVRDLPPIIEIVDKARVEQFAKLGFKVVEGQELRWSNFETVEKRYFCLKHMRYPLVEFAHSPIESTHKQA